MCQLKKKCASVWAVIMILGWLLVASLPAQAQGFCPNLGDAPTTQNYFLISASGEAVEFSGCFAAGMEVGGGYSISLADITNGAELLNVTVRDSTGTMTASQSNISLGGGFGASNLTAGGLYSFAVLARGNPFASVRLGFESYAAPIPEPTSLVLFAAGLAAVGALYRRRVS